MLIKSLEVENWKCFKKNKESFDLKNIINRPNGTGKSSIFEAIIFGLFGKTPPGFNLNTLRLDERKPCKVLVKFSHKGDEYHAFRQFGSGSYVAIKKNGETMASSSREAFEYINEIIPYDIMSVLWAPNTLSSSNILKPSFLIDHLLNYLFEDPKILLNHFKSELFAQNKIVKSIEQRISMNEDDIDRSIASINKKIDEIKSRLKERTSSTDSQANAAMRARSAQSEIDKGVWTDILDKGVLNSYISIVGRNDPEVVLKEMSDRLSNEENKKDSDLLNIAISSLRVIKSKSEDSSKCMVCSGDWSEDASNKIKDVLDNPESKNSDVIESLKRNIDLIKNSKDKAATSAKFYDLKSQVEACPNWEDILNNYNKENDNLWKSLEKAQKDLENVNRQKELTADYFRELKISKDLSKNVDMISVYIREASAYYSRALTEEATKIINSINNRYDQVYLDSGQYKVAVISENMSSMNLLPVAQLSSGERTLIGISLILSAHKLFFSYAPLLFDESFSALDSENIQGLKDVLLDKSKNQIFIITHDQKWTELVGE